LSSRLRLPLLQQQGGLTRCTAPSPADPRGPEHLRPPCCFWAIERKRKRARMSLRGQDRFGSPTRAPRGGSGRFGQEPSPRDHEFNQRLCRRREDFTRASRTGQGAAVAALCPPSAGDTARFNLHDASLKQSRVVRRRMSRRVGLVLLGRSP
jgi:hypothetical protein